MPLLCPRSPVQILMPHNPMYFVYIACDPMRVMSTWFYSLLLLRLVSMFVTNDANYSVSS
jgi:hypothetical protein